MSRPNIDGSTIESQEEPATDESPTSRPTEEPKVAPVTTNDPKPMQVPDTVFIRITIDNLKEYVGPPVYQKDRMYAKPPPPGVSTGLGYLGNGSGAVMPIEAMVRACQL